MILVSLDLEPSDLEMNYKEELILAFTLGHSIRASHTFRQDSCFSTNCPRYIQHDRSGEALEVQKGWNGEVRGVAESFAMH